ncbi:hypothetical protein H5410_055852 [Solanum commersonii]|uniref:Ferric reductase NAD binding domain-containing protein n=1 Tax=Solanum commersonii TaxID=4109 RepID=A0A9J5WLG1_SOLCO|nr:hypothetical protein H5410_055852 [Solanum commersonii]
MNELGVANAIFEEYFSEQNMSGSSNIIAAPDAVGSNKKENCDMCFNFDFDLKDVNFDNVDFLFLSQELPSCDLPNEQSNGSMPKLLIDGPYGAQDYKKYDVVLLVVIGIGATPLICIVKDVLNNIKQKKDISDSLVESGHKGSKKVVLLLNGHTSIGVYEEGDAWSALITLCFNQSSKLKVVLTLSLGQGSRHILLDQIDAKFSNMLQLIILIIQLVREIITKITDHKSNFSRNRTLH